MNQKPVYIYAKWQVREGQLATVLHLIGEVAKKSAAEEGNLFYKIHQSHADDHTLILFEGYVDETAVEVHRNSAHFQGVVVEQIVPLLVDREVVLMSAVV